jgi:hypothetical protein
LKTHRLAHSRFAAVGVAVLAAAALALAGCKTTSNTTKPTANSSSAASSIAPQAALLSAFAKLKTTGYDISVTSSAGDLSGTGSVDPGKSASLNATGSFQGTKLQLSAVQLGTDVYVKLDLGQLNSVLSIPTQWMKLDTTKLNKPIFDAGSGLSFDVAKLASAVTNVTATDAQHISGTIDFSKLAGSIMAMPSSSAGASAQTGTFQATLDSQGRLIELKLNEGSNQSQSQDIKLSNYGSPSPVTAPTDSIPAPDAIYQFLNR